MTKPDPYGANKELMPAREGDLSRDYIQNRYSTYTWSTFSPGQFVNDILNKSQSYNIESHTFCIHSDVQVGDGLAMP